MLALRSGLLTALVLFVIAWLSLPLRFDVNDDYGALSILSGADGFPAQPDVPFISRLMNHVLFWLYELFPRVPWFGGFVYLAAVLGCGCFLSLLFFDDFHPLGRLMLAPAMIVMLSHCLYSVTFTSAALLLLLGSLAHLAAVLKSGREGVHWWGFAGCLVLAYLWRWQLTLFFLVFALPVLLFTRRRHLKALLPLAATLAIVVADRWLDSRYYASPEQQAFARFYHLRSTFHDRPLGRLGEQRGALQAAGWSEEDYTMYRGLWILHNDESFNSETLSRFLEANRQFQPTLSRRVLDGVLLGLRENRGYLLLTFCGLVSVLLARWSDLRRSGAGGMDEQPTEEKGATETGREENRKEGKGRAWKNWFGEAWRDVLALLLLLGPALFLLYFRFVPRVSIPLLVYLLCWSLLFRRPEISAQPWSERHPNSQWTIVVAGLLTLLVGGRIIVREIGGLHDSLDEKRTTQRCLQELLRRSVPEPLLIRMEPGTGIRHDAAHPLHREPIWNRLRVLPSGWQTGTKRYRDILKGLGYGSGRQMLAGTVNSRYVYFVQLTYSRSQEDGNLRLWTSYFQRHIARPQQSISFVPLLRCKHSSGRVLSVYRCRAH